MRTSEKEQASRLAARLSTLPFALFSAWLSGLLLFWLKALGPLRSFGTPPPEAAPAPWLIGSAAIGALALLLPRACYRPAPFERGGQLYEKLGIRRFRALMANGDLINRFVRRRHAGYVVHPAACRLERAVVEGFKSERAHLALMAFGLGTAAFACVAGWTWWGAWLTVGNILVNLYPVLLQRYTRGRIDRIAPDIVRRILDQPAGSRSGRLSNSS
jgi:hypothetical protein